MDHRQIRITVRFIEREDRGVDGQHGPNLLPERTADPIVYEIEEQADQVEARCLQQIPAKAARLQPVLHLCSVRLCDV